MTGERSALPADEEQKKTPVDVIRIPVGPQKALACAIAADLVCSVDPGGGQDMSKGYLVFSDGSNG